MISGPITLELVTAALGEAGVGVESIDDRLIGELGVVMVGTRDDDAAPRALLEVGLRALTTGTVIFRLPDRPGALAAAWQRFAQHQLNVQAIHIVHRHAGHAIVAVSTDDDDAGRSLLDDDSLLS